MALSMLQQKALILSQKSLNFMQGFQNVNVTKYSCQQTQNSVASMAGGQSGQLSTQILAEQKTPSGSIGKPHYYLPTQLQVAVDAPEKLHSVYHCTTKLRSSYTFQPEKVIAEFNSFLLAHYYKLYNLLTWQNIQQSKYKMTHLRRYSMERTTLNKVGEFMTKTTTS